MYRVELNGTLDRLRIPSAISVSILDADRVVVENMTAVSGVFKISKPRLWWPYTISNKPYAYLYQLEVSYCALPTCPKEAVYSVMPLFHYHVPQVAKARST